jgi:ABC-type nitrate/sulfonate/bicarbonate transport system permease component
MRRARAIWPPLLVGVGGLVLWELFIDVLGVQEFLLPRPLAIWSALTDDWSTIWAGAKKTAWVAVSGLIAGVVVAVVGAFVTTRSRLLAETVTPMASALAATPIVALAPVYFKWFGSVEPTARQAVVVSVVLFPVFVSTARGLLEVDATSVELMRTYAAGEWRILWEVRVPERAALLPHLAQGGGLAQRHRRHRVGVLRRRARDPRRDHHPVRRAHPLRPGVGCGHRRLAARCGPLRGREPPRAAARAVAAGPAVRMSGTTRPTRPTTHHPHGAPTDEQDTGVRALAALLALSLLPAACGDDDDDDDGSTAATAEGRRASAEATPVKLQLQWFAQGQFAGYYAALAEGYYEEEGLDVEIVEGGVDIVPQTQLATGAADFAIAWVPKALASREQGEAITNIGQIFQRSGTLQVSWADAGIDGPEDLAGKKVGNWGFGNEFELFAGLTQAGIEPQSDVTLVQQQFDMTALLAREIDAAQAMTYNEYAQLLETTDPRPASCTRRTTSR